MNGLRLAHPGDLERIHRLIIREAAAGHFDARLAQRTHSLRLKRNLASIVRHGRRLDEPLEAQLLVLEARGIPVAFAINSAILPGAGNELWMLATRPRYRGQGQGGGLLDGLLARLAPRVAVYARCYPPSTAMQQMLVKRGFALLEETAEGLRVYRRGRGEAGGEGDVAVQQMLAPYVALSL